MKIFKKTFRKMTLSFLVILLFMSNILVNTFALTSKDIKIQSSGGGGSINLTIEFPKLFRLNPEENTEISVLEGSGDVFINEEKFDYTPKPLQIKTENNSFNLKVDSNIDEDIIVNIRTSTFSLILALNTQNSHASVTSFEPFIETDEPDYVDENLSHNVNFRSSITNLNNSQEAMDFIQKSNFAFPNNEVNVNTIKDQVDLSLGDQFENEIIYNKTNKCYEISIWSKNDKQDLVKEPLYINSDVNINFDEPKILRYSSLRQITANDSLIENGSLKIKKNNSSPYGNVVLPISNYGRNYTIEAEVIHNGGANNSRWIALSYGLKPINPNENTWSFWQMAIRKNATATNGVEFANMTPSGNWNVKATSPYKEVLKDNTPYKLTIVVEGNEVREYINDELLVVSSLPIEDRDGKIAFSYNNANAELKSLKVTGEIPKNLPKEIVIDDIQNEYVSNIYQPKTQIQIPPTIVANNFNDFTSLASEIKRPATIIFDLDEDLNVIESDTKIPLGSAIESIKKNAMIAFRTDSESTAFKLSRFIDNNKIVDAFIISKNPEIIKEITNHTGMRGVLDLTDKEISKDNLINIVHETNKSNSRIALIPQKLAKRENIKYIQARAIATWVLSDSEDKSLYNNILSGAYGIVTEKPLDAINFIESFKDPSLGNILTRNTIIAAHRSVHTDIPIDIPELNLKAGANLPENSISALKAAMAIHADAAESDVYLAKDNVLVMNHDARTGRLSNKDVLVEDLTSSELKEIKYKEKPDEGIATLDEFFDASKDSDIIHVIEIKSGNLNIGSYLRDTVYKHNMQDRVIFISFSKEQCEKMREFMPEISVGYLGGVTTAITPKTLAVKKLTETLSPMNAFFNNNMSLANYEQAQFSNHRGILFHPWTIRDRGIYEEYFSKSYHGETTDFPFWGMDYLSSVTSSKDSYTKEEVDNNNFIAKSNFRNGNSIDLKNPKLIKIKDQENLFLLGDSYELNNIGKKYTVVSEVLSLKEKGNEKAVKPKNPEEQTNPSKPEDPTYPESPQNPSNPLPLNPEENKEDYYYNSIFDFSRHEHPKTYPVNISFKEDNKNKKNNYPQDINGYWAEDSIKKVLDENLMELINSNFIPNKNSTRAEIVRALAKLEKIDLDSYDKKIFKDVDSNTEIGKMIAWAYENKIIAGYEDGNFRMNNSITREEFASILNRYVVNLNKKFPLEEPVAFTDSKEISTWAKDDVNKAVERGLIYGYEDKSFKPKHNISRAEVAQIFTNLMK